MMYYKLTAGVTFQNKIALLDNEKKIEHDFGPFIVFQSTVLVCALSRLVELACTGSALHCFSSRQFSCLRRTK